MSRSLDFFDYLFDSKYSTSHGSAKFASYWERRKLLKSSHQGVYLANELRLPNDYAHLILLSPTSGGKSTRYVLNNALRVWNKRSSLIFFDPSGQIYQNSAAWLSRKQKFKLLKLDLNNPAESVKYNPLMLVDNKSSARMVAQSIIGAIYSKSNADPFWSESAIGIGTLLILAMKLILPESQQNLPFLNRLVNKFGHSQDEIDVLMESGLSDEDFDEYASFMGNSFKVRQSILATLKSALYIYSDDILKQICTDHSLNFSDLRNQKTALFLVQDESKIPYFKAWWSTFYRQLFEFLMQPSEGNSVYIFADEFANVGTIPDFGTTIISTIRKRRVFLSIIAQSYQQIYDCYQERAKIILDNCNHKLFYSSLNYDTSALVSRMLGNATESYSDKGIYKRHQNLHRTSRALLTPDEVRTMKSDQALLISANHHPIHLKKVLPFYKNGTLKRRSRL